MKRTAVGRPFRSPRGDRDASTSVLRDDRPTPSKPVVDAQLDGMLVVVEAASDDRRRAAGEARVAEVVVLVFAFDRPVRREHVFDAGADRVAVAVVLVDREGHRYAAGGHADVVVVAPGITALG